MSQQAQAQVYCVPPESTFGGPLSGFTNVQLGTLNNTSANEGYTDYTSTVASVSLQRSSSYTPSFVLYYVCFNKADIWCNLRSAYWYR